MSTTDHFSDLRLRRSVELFCAPDDAIYLLRTDGEPDVLIECATPSQRAALAALADGSWTGSDDVDELLRGLADVDVLENTYAPAAALLDAEERERYDRGFAVDDENRRRRAPGGPPRR